MALIRCPHCGEDTFTITGWADLDHCAACGHPIGTRASEVGAAIEARQRLLNDDGAISSGTTAFSRPGSGHRSSHEPEPTR